MPVSKKQSQNYDLHFLRFQGNSANLREKYEYALAASNAEVGAHFDQFKNLPLYFAAGPYYINGKGGSTWGGQARASIQIFDYLKIDGNVSYDHLFKWIGQGQIGVNISFGGKKKSLPQKNNHCNTLLTLAERSYQPVDRFEIIPVDKKHKESVSKNPSTGLPYQFIFVDNTSSSLGTYESPYHSLADAEANSNPYNIIYIFPGDGTSTGLNQGIALQNYQKLWGSGINQTLSTTAGQVIIPAQSSGIYNGVVITPIITNTSGSVVVVQNGNEISGLFLENQGTYDCITCTGRNNLTILNSTLASANSPGAIGVNAIGLSGYLSVSRCNINQATNGILLQNSSDTLTATISNSILSSAGGSNGAIQWILTNSAVGQLNVDNCTATTHNNAVEIDLSNTSSIITSISNNTFSTGSKGLYINSGSGETTINANIKNNQMTTYSQSVWVTQTGNAILNLSGNDLFATSEPTLIC